VGDILGAGIYALVGTVVQQAGTWAWLSFLLVVGIAMLTALSYAELGGRFPRSGGEAYFCQQASGWAFASLLVGYLVLVSGLVSLSTVSLAFSGYVCRACSIDPHLGRWLIIPGFLLFAASIAAWGIRQSSYVNVVCTIVEATGLLFVIAVGTVFLWRQPVAAVAVMPVKAIDWAGVLAGGSLAFYAFIGFEDMVNVAEEVRRPERIIPAAILTALGLSATIYLAIAWVATRVVPADQLASSTAPLLEVVRTAAPRFPLGLFSAVALFAVTNTGLLNLVMGSRLLYGLATQGLLPRGLAVVDPRTQTPRRAIGVMFFAALALALSGTLRHLAGTTNFLLLLVFSSVNVSLLVIRSQDRAAWPGFQVPRVFALLGALTCLGLIPFLPWTSLVMGMCLLALGVALTALHGRRGIAAG
jgi:amino acid transporter